MLAKQKGNNSSFSTPEPRKPRSKERQDRLYKEGILSSPFSPGPVRVSRTKKTSCSHTAEPRSTNRTTKRQKQNTDTKQNTETNHETRKRSVVFHLIRHGQSLGQTADQHRRCSDARLLDCGLSRTGMEQARNIRLPNTVQLLVSSPLTRAVATACLANVNHGLPILIHYHLRELGSMIPENIPRRPKAVQDDLELTYGINLCKNGTTTTSAAAATDTLMIDWDTLMPEDWPRRHDECPKMIRRDRVRDALYYLATQRSETEMAIFCHYHVIQAAVAVRADNAVMISCEMCIETGELRLLNSTTASNNENDDYQPMESD
jgi:Histidine phosphatase superfamily (branch 1)